jgi:uncharacterized membrane protein
MIIFFLVLISVVSMSAAQLFLKKGMLAVGQYPQDFSQIVFFFLKACTNIYVILAFVFTAVTALAWIMAVSTKAQLSFIYPFMALSYVLVALFSMLLFKENVTPWQWWGIAAICAGIFLMSR